MLDYIKPIQLNAQLMARLDVLLSFSRIAIEHNYVKPEINESFVLDIKNGRHPVIETQLPLGEKYVANDMYLDNEKQQIIIITGPNMSGKSALLRQTALIVLMAQIGSFVPAEAARIYIRPSFLKSGTTAFTKLFYTKATSNLKGIFPLYYFTA
jgi:DNA mismatch repair protein MutS